MNALSKALRCFLLILSFTVVVIPVQASFAQNYYNVPINRDVSDQANEKPQEYASQQKFMKPQQENPAVEEWAFAVDSVGFNLLEFLEILAWLTVLYFWIAAKREHTTWKPFYRFLAGLLIFKFCFWIVNILIVKS